MQWYFAGTLMTVIAVIIGVRRRVRRDGMPDAMVGQLIGGINIYIAAMLAFVTFALFKFGDFYFVHASVAFALLLAAAWVVWGLVPVRDRYETGWKGVIGHILVLLGTMLFGSVTYFIPVLEWFGILPGGSGAVLPWLGLITFPIALLLWPLGLWLVWVPRPEISLERTREG
jgi:hypothetical protein